MQIMPFEEAKTYRFNPFDLTKVWPHGDYPLIEVGKMTLNRNVDRLPHRDRAGGVRAEQPRARHRPEPGQDAAGPRVLLRRRAPRPARRQLQADPGQRSRRSPVHSYTKDGAMRDRATPPTRCTRRTRRAARRPTRSATAERGTGTSDGDMVRTAYTLRPDDDDWGQAGTLVREVMDDDARDRLVDNIVGHLLDGRDASRCCRGRSSTGATSTRDSATGSSRRSAPAESAPAARLRPQRRSRAPAIRRSASGPRPPASAGRSGRRRPWRRARPGWRRRPSRRWT